jgi:hypothetical protein
MDQSEAKEGSSSENASESLPPQPPRKKKETKDQRLEKSAGIINTLFKPNYGRVSTFREYDSRKIAEL